MARLAGQGAQGILMFLPLGLGIIGTYSHPGFFIQHPGEPNSSPQALAVTLPQPPRFIIKATQCKIIHEEV